MNLREFYEKIGGNYDEAIQRLMNDALIEKFVKKFPLDENFKNLKEAMGSKDIESAFTAAHTLKGVAMNLAFGDLGKSANALTDALRPENRNNLNYERLESLFSQSEMDYIKTISAINEI